MRRCCCVGFDDTTLDLLAPERAALHHHTFRASLTFDVYIYHEGLASFQCRHGRGTAQPVSFFEIARRENHASPTDAEEREKTKAVSVLSPSGVASHRIPVTLAKKPRGQLCSGCSCLAHESKMRL